MHNGNKTPAKGFASDFRGKASYRLKNINLTQCGNVGLSNHDPRKPLAQTVTHMIFHFQATSATSSG